MRLAVPFPWKETRNSVLKFFEPTVDNYPSHSVYLFKASGKYIDAPVDRLSHFMKKFSHSKIDLVKMEIEGAEYTVLDTIVKDKLDVKIICVEFDEVFHVRGLPAAAEKSRLFAGAFHAADEAHFYPEGYL